MNLSHKYVLVLNTAVNHYISLALFEKDENAELLLIDNIFRKVKYRQSENLLRLVDFILEKNQIKKEHLMDIIVVVGPGSFTSVRLAVNLANIWSLFLSVNLLAYELEKEIKDSFTILVWKKILKQVRKDYENKKLKRRKFLKPIYNSEAHIGKSKKNK